MWRIKDSNLVGNLAKLPDRHSWLHPRAVFEGIISLLAVAYLLVGSRIHPVAASKKDQHAMPMHSRAL